MSQLLRVEAEEDEEEESITHPPNGLV